MARIVGVVLAGLLGVAGALSVVLLARPPGTPVNELAILLMVATYATVAVIISLTRPDHPVGRLMLAGSCIWGLGEGSLALAVRALANGQAETAGWLGVVGTTAWGLGWLMLILGLPLIFPDGRTPWGRRAVVLAVSAVGFGLPSPRRLGTSGFAPGGCAFP